MTFPPGAPTTLTKVVPSYLYKQYEDDDDLQAFVAAQNAAAQDYVTFFSALNLPIYTQPQIAGALLDWVAEGIYGRTRPSFSSGLQTVRGPFNTWTLNSLPFNGRKTVGTITVAGASDDIFKRVITWHCYKGDGKHFNVRWLKRRIMRFLNGANGTDVVVDQTYVVSISFGPNNQVSVTFLGGRRSVTGGAIFNRFTLNSQPFNALQSQLVFVSVIPPLVNTLIEGLKSGALELPFQFTWVFNVVPGPTILVTDAGVEITSDAGAAIAPP